MPEAEAPPAPGRQLRPGCMYYLVWLSLKLISRIFFRAFKTGGLDNVPPDGAIIFAGNHGNGLVDAVIMFQSTPRLTSFLAKAPLFRMLCGCCGCIMRSALVVPVHRRQDNARGEPLEFAAVAERDEVRLVPPGESKPNNGVVLSVTADAAEVDFRKVGAVTVPRGWWDSAASNAQRQVRADNSAMFRTVEDTLLGGGCIGIFPEGISHARSELQELKNGMAHMALGAKRRDPARPISIVPVGLNYTHGTGFRGGVLTSFGVPIEVSAEAAAGYAAGGDAANEAVTGVMRATEEGLRLVTTNADDWETLELVQLACSLYYPTGFMGHIGTYEDRLMLARFSSAYERLRDDPAVARMRGDLQAYQRRLTALGIEDLHVRKQAGMSCCGVAWRMMARIVVAVVGVPFGAAALLVFLPIYLPGKCASRAAAGSQGTDVVATYKILVAILISPLVFGAYDGILAWQLAGVAGVPWWGWLLISFFGLPLVAYIALRVGEAGWSWGWRCVRLARICGLRGELRRLEEERAALHTAVVALVRSHASDDERRRLRELRPGAPVGALTAAEAETVLDQYVAGPGAAGTGHVQQRQQLTEEEELARPLIPDARAAD